MPPAGRWVSIKAAAGDDVESVGAKPRDGEIGLDPAAPVAELGIDDAADGPIHLRGSKMLECGKRPPSRKFKFAEGRLVDQRYTLAHGTMLARHRLEPVRPAERRAVDRLRASEGEPVGPLPPRLGAEDGALFPELRIERAAADAACAFMFEAGIGDLIVMAVELHGARIHEGPRVVMKGEAAHIQRPEIEAGLALHDPFRHHAPGAAASGDAIEESGGDIAVIQFRRFAHDEIAIGGIGDRAIYQLAHAHLLQDRGAFGGQCRQLFEAVEVSRQ